MVLYYFWQSDTKWTVARPPLVSKSFSSCCEPPRTRWCNTQDVTFHICNSNSCHFRPCVMIFPPWLVFFFCFAFYSCHAYHVMSSRALHFAYVFVSCIRAFSPLSVSQSDTPTCTGAPLLSLFISGCWTFSEWTEACQVTLVYHPETTGQVLFHLEVVWYSNG